MSNDVTDAPPPPPPTSTPPKADRPDRDSSPSALLTGLVAIGVGLLASGAAVAAAYSRFDGELDLSVYAVGVGASAALLLLAIVAAVRPGRAAGGDGPALTGWAGSVGILALAVMLGIGLEDVSGLGYLLGGLITVLSVAGYIVSRHAAFVTTAILGLGVLYANGFGDLYGDIASEDHFGVSVGLALAIFVVTISLFGWLLPTRVLSAQIAGWIGVVGCTALLGTLAMMSLVGGILGGMFGPMLGPGMFESEEFEMPDDFGMPEDMEVPEDIPMPDDAELDVSGWSMEFPEFTLDVWVVLGIAGFLTLAWALAAALTRHAGFTLLAVVMPVATVPFAVIALAAEHPTAWELVLAGSGALALAAAALLALRRS